MAYMKGDITRDRELIAFKPDCRYCQYINILFGSYCYVGCEVYHRYCK